MNFARFRDDGDSVAKIRRDMLFNAGLDECPCSGMESFIVADTGRIPGGVGLACTLCGRDFEVREIEVKCQHSSSEHTQAQRLQS